MSACRSCGAEVIFVPSAKTGKPMILDAKPEKRVVLVRSNDQQVIYRATPGSADPAARVIDTYIDHHATCPQAAEWKGRRRAG
jgi:arginine repressor